jgi:membrane-bound ClpP family serine protease
MVMWTIIISLLIIGLVLLIVEVVFIPGTTVVGILGVIFSITGVVISYRHFGNTTGFYVLFSTLLATGGALFYSFKSGTWDRFSLKDTNNGKVNEGLTATLSVGEQGVAVSTLRPSGKAEFKNELFEVRSQGGYVEANTRVRIIEINQQQIIVEPLNNE